jgi:hypothetical protein
MQCTIKDRKTFFICLGKQSLACSTFSKRAGLFEENFSYKSGLSKAKVLRNIVTSE